MKYITNVMNETVYIITDPEDIKWLVRDYFDQSIEIHLMI